MRALQFTAVRSSARVIGALGVTLLAMTGCASLEPLQGGVDGGSVPAAIAPADFPPPSPTPPTPFPYFDTTPRMIIPVTGGLPVLGIPQGGNIFLPVTGGLPVIGIPISP